MTTENRIEALSILGDWIKKKEDSLEQVIASTFIKNSWFTKANIHIALDAIANSFLNEDKLRNWIDGYDFSTSDKTVGLVLAGNIPLVGFHDWLSVFISGNHAKLKLSDKDPYLLKFLLEKLVELNPGMTPQWTFTHRLKGFDAAIATGSNNTARYFEKYFGAYPNIIRKNRNSVAILHGNESAEELKKLNVDIFRFFGLGCRSVSKLYLPKGYDLQQLMASFDSYKDLIYHNKYKNNYDYNRALLLLNRVDHLANHCIMLVENKAIPSRITVLHYEFYDDLKSVEQEIEASYDQLQCVVGDASHSGKVSVNYGMAQNPELTDYADHVDTLAFLSRL